MKPYVPCTRGGLRWWRSLSTTALETGRAWASRRLQVGRADQLEGVAVSPLAPHTAVAWSAATAHFWDPRGGAGHGEALPGGAGGWEPTPGRRFAWSPVQRETSAAALHSYCVDTHS